MRVRISQLVVEKDISTNLGKMLSVIEKSGKDEWTIFPEGMLSGYYPEEESYPANLDHGRLGEGITAVSNAVKERRSSCIFGTAYFERGNWFNVAILIDRGGNQNVYKKVNLATLDRRCFAAGDDLAVLKAGKNIVGIQLCRENAFPEQWKVLKRKGAQVVFHINNAIKESDLIRRDLLIARAFENQFFVISVNNASYPQTLPSLAISPYGKILYETRTREEEVGVIDIDLDDVSTQYLEQERRDVVDLDFR